MGFQEIGCGRGLDISGAVYGQVAGSCESGNETSGPIKCGEFLDWLRTAIHGIYWLVNRLRARRCFLF
jgi:hypothetical protein